MMQNKPNHCPGGVGTVAFSLNCRDLKYVRSKKCFSPFACSIICQEVNLIYCVGNNTAKSRPTTLIKFRSWTLCRGYGVLNKSAQATLKMTMPKYYGQTPFRFLSKAKISKARNCNAGQKHTKELSKLGSIALFHVFAYLVMCVVWGSSFGFLKDE